MFKYALSENVVKFNTYCESGIVHAYFIIYYNYNMVFGLYYYLFVLYV